MLIKILANSSATNLAANGVYVDVRGNVVATPALFPFSCYLRHCLGALVGNARR